MPWSSRDIPLGDKVEQFFGGMEELEAKMNSEQLMQNFFFVHATVALIRLIFQTAAHPRTAILINTLTEAAGDLWHFIILFCAILWLPGARHVAFCAEKGRVFDIHKGL